MTPEEKSLLERTLKLAEQNKVILEQNNAILVGLRRSNRVSTGVKIAYWTVIILLSFGAYYLIQPYITFLTGLSTPSAADGTSGSTRIIPSTSQVQEAAASLKQLMQGQ